MTIKELKPLVEAALKNTRRTREGLKDATNPQSREMFSLASGKCAAYLAVLDAIKGQKYMIGCDINGHILQD